MNHLDPKENYGADPWRTPKLEADDTVIYSECGRVIDNICYRSHWLMIVKGKYGPYYLVVKHGGGQERIAIDYTEKAVKALANLESEQRYLLMYTMLSMSTEAYRRGIKDGEEKYRKAFVDGKLKKRKLPKQNAVKTWIES